MTFSHTNGTLLLQQIIIRALYDRNYDVEQQNERNHNASKERTMELTNKTVKQFSSLCRFGCGVIFSSSPANLLNEYIVNDEVII